MTSSRRRMTIAAIIIGLASLATCSLIMTPSRYGFGAEALPTQPDPRLTPGVVASSDPAIVCATGAASYSRQHRRTAAAVKRQVYAAYRIVPAGRDFEIDHRLPLALGGADVAGNLWPQLGWIHPSYHDKDRLETHVWHLVCGVRTMTLEAGQAIFLGDWIEAYGRIFGGPPR